MSAYSITVEARADGSDDFDSEVVSVIVTNVDETGVIKVRSRDVHRKTSC